MRSGISTLAFQLMRSHLSEGEIGLVGYTVKPSGSRAKRCMAPLTSQSEPQLCYFAPVIYYEGWLKDYQELFKQVDDTIRCLITQVVV